jgi:nicotinamide riboside kinase
MKIYFIGAHSVGKTTLTRYVNKKYNIPILPEIARLVLAQEELNVDSLRSDILVVNSYQTEIFNRQLLEESKLVDFVADRSLLDCIAYSAQHSIITNELIQRPEFEQYINDLKDAIIFFVRPSKATLKNDGVREQLNWDAVVSIDAMLKLLLEIYSIKYYQINTDSMQERIRIIDNILFIVK